MQLSFVESTGSTRPSTKPSMLTLHHQIARDRIASDSVAETMLLGHFPQPHSDPTHPPSSIFYLLSSPSAPRVFSPRSPPRRAAGRSSNPQVWRDRAALCRQVWETVHQGRRRTSAASSRAAHLQPTARLIRPHSETAP